MYRSTSLAMVTGVLVLAFGLPSGCSKKVQPQLVVYCGIDEPYASEIFKAFEQQTGIHVAAQYDAEASRSVGVFEKLQSEAEHPHADVWWSNEPLLSVRLADAGVLAPYRPPIASDIADRYKDSQGFWTGVGLRARVLIVAEPGPGFEVEGLQDLLDPRLKGKIALSRPLTGAITAHIAALWVTWGPEKTRSFLRGLHDNSATLLGGNSLVADAVGRGDYLLGLTDSDDVANTIANGGKARMLLPDQAGDGAMVIPTTVALVKGAPHEADAKKLVDFLLSKQCEQKLLEQKYVRWSTRDGALNSIMTMKVDYRAAANVYPQAVRESNAILDGRTP